MPRVLVTGAGRRLGREIALASARAGWDVMVHYHRSAGGAQRTVREIRALGRHAAGVRGDLGRPADCRRVIRRAGPLDAVVSSAAGFFPTPLPHTTPRQWDRLLDLNLKGPFFLAQAFSVRSRGGVFVQILDAGKAWRRYAVYGISKAGAEAMVVILARALAPRIRVHGVSPGRVALGGRKGIPPERVCDAVLRALQARATGRIYRLSSMGR